MPKWLLIIGVILGIGTAILVNIHIQNIEDRQTSAPFLRLDPGVELTKGQAVEQDMLRTEHLPESLREMRRVALPDTEETRAWIDGRAVTRDIPAGGFLLHEHFADDPGQRFAARISSSMRAVTIPVDAASSVAFFVQPGSSVDILGTFNDEQGDQRSMFTRTVLQNVKVLAVGRAISRGNYLSAAEDGFSTVTVEVSSMDAEKLVFALSQAVRGLTLVLRSVDDDEVAEIPRVDWDALHAEQVYE